MRNALTIDLEDYFQVTAFADHVDRSDWHSCESRIQRNASKILELLGSNGTKATFFVLGWVAENYPQVVSEIANCGHEIACHSYYHRPVYELLPEDFREDTLRAKASLEDACGKPVRGYRAPSFSITSGSLWALNILAELGFTYDSSIFPVKHPDYGMPHASRLPFVIETESGSLVEFPMATLELGRWRSPIGGGAYLRLLPYWYTRWGLRYLNGRENHPVCVYLHPWELDPDQPRLDKSRTARLRHYWGLRGMERKLQKLLRDFEFCPVGSFVEEHRVLEQPATVKT